MKKGFACGIFDLFHPGHVRMLKECKEHCDYLYVGLNIASHLPDEKNKPVFSAPERKEILESCKYVDEVLCYDGEDQLLHLIRSLEIDIRFLGEDYRGRNITGDSPGITIHYTNRSHGYSSTVIRSRIHDH